MVLLSLTIWQHIVKEFFNISPLEWVGFTATIACVYLAARQSIWNWPVGIISVTTYCFIYYQSQLFGDAALQIYFFGTSVYGWYFWLKKDKAQEKPIVSLPWGDIVIVLLGTVALSYMLGLFLQTFTPTNVPYIDGFCTAVSFMAQILMTRKVLQNWALWIFVDICYVPLYIYKSLYLTSLLYIVLLVLAYMGHIDWRKEYKKQTVPA
ncbi:nicotinamide riboside transporter PnuC [Mucilaginibacter sp. HMF5004]|uniref:nicotinamide riboside transporter PnuC n=1 Tax=Mucilaginibacter rivuli TaxID=2857527 RepID=UPI001C5F5677|nr:nicotinamide riboside transporter PnuC [Mucilaginibacter rivuli]MBW4888643.1 nicotinamide riboside transporter PnuC [Mucilaginibacter rivuli]